MMIVTLESELLAELVKLDKRPDTTIDARLQEELDRSVRRSHTIRMAYYAAALLVALFGTATGAIEKFGLPWYEAIAGVIVLELGGVVFLNDYDVRRRIGEHAWAARIVAVAVAGATATFNIISHGSYLKGSFYAGVSVLAFVSWAIDVGNKRRDRRRAAGKLAETTPEYELWEHWIKHPVITRRAKILAKTYPQLGTYGSLQGAMIVINREQRNDALTAALQKEIEAAHGKDGKRMARIAVLTYDMEQVARRLRDGADYDGLSALLGAQLTADRMLAGSDDAKAAAARKWLAEHLAIEETPLPGTAPVPPALNGGHTFGQWPVPGIEAGTDRPGTAPVPATDRTRPAPANRYRTTDGPVPGRGTAPGTEPDATVPVPASGTARPAALRDRPDTITQRVPGTERDGRPGPVPALTVVPARHNADDTDDVDDVEDDTVEPAKTGKARARAVWEQHLGQGWDAPTGAHLARAGGVTDSLGRRWARDWSRELDDQDGTTGLAAGSHSA
jgi:hypothetical protein